MQGILHQFKSKVRVILFCTQCLDFTTWEMKGDKIICSECGQEIETDDLQSYIDDVYPKVLRRFTSQKS